MIYKDIKLNKYYSFLKNSDASLRIYLYEQNEEYGKNYLRPGILVIPGGGYDFVSEREKDPVAFRFLSEGFNAFALTYTLKTPYPAPQLEVLAAMDFIRNHSKEYCLIENKIGLVGFSAGGHLAGSYGYTYKELAKENKIDLKIARPDFIMLGYPVITMFENTHRATVRNIAGENKKLLEKMSIEKHVGKDYPPTFVWTTREDGLVNPVHTEMMRDALKASGVKSKTLIFKRKDHGMSIATNATTMNYKVTDKDSEIVSSWVHEAVNFVLKLK